MARAPVSIARYLSATPTLVDGQVHEMLFDVSGNLKVSGSFTPSGTQDVNIKQIAGTSVLTGAGATGAGSERVTVAQDSSTVAGSSSLPTGTNAIGSVGSLLTGPNVGQTTSNTTAVQLQVGSIPAKNGMLVQALSTNTASVFIGGSGVTVNAGYELTAGQAVPFTASDINVLYVIGANNTDKICFNVL